MQIEQISLLLAHGTGDKAASWNLYECHLVFMSYKKYLLVPFDIIVGKHGIERNERSGKLKFYWMMKVCNASSIHDLSQTSFFLNNDFFFKKLNY